MHIIYIFHASAWGHHDSVLGNDRIIVCFIDHYKPFRISAWFIAFKILSPFLPTPLPWGQLSRWKAHWLWAIQLTMTEKKKKTLEMIVLTPFLWWFPMILSSRKEHRYETELRRNESAGITRTRKEGILECKEWVFSFKLRLCHQDVVLAYQDASVILLGQDHRQLQHSGA